MIGITATSEDAPAVIPKNIPLISDDWYPYMTMDVCRLVDSTGTVEVAQLEIRGDIYRYGSQRISGSRVIKGSHCCLL